MLSLVLKITQISENKAISFEKKEVNFEHHLENLNKYFCLYFALFYLEYHTNCSKSIQYYLVINIR